MYGAMGPENNVLLRSNKYSTVDVVPGQLRWFDNKGADFGTTIGNVTNTSVSGVVNVENIDGTGYWAVRAYNPTGVALTAGLFYELFHTGSMDKDPSVRLFVDGTTTVGRTAVCATTAVPAASWGWFAIQGIFPNASVGFGASSAVVAGTMLKITTNNGSTGVSSLKADGTNLTLNTIAVSLGANSVDAPAVGNSVYIFGRQAYVNQT